jgi:isoamylase
MDRVVDPSLITAVKGDQPLRLPMQDLVIYEAHVRGFTQSRSSHVASPGTYNGMTERLDYLQQLGITAIELLPVFEFNELEYYTPIPGTGLYRYNFWGYSTVAFFAPMSRFASDVRLLCSCTCPCVERAQMRGRRLVHNVSIWVQHPESRPNT